MTSLMYPSCTQTIFPFKWIEDNGIFSNEVCGRMNWVDINHLIIDENKISYVFDISDDNEDHFVADIDPENII